MYLGENRIMRQLKFLFASFSLTCLFQTSNLDPRVSNDFQPQLMSSGRFLGIFFVNRKPRTRREQQTNAEFKTRDKSKIDGYNVNNQQHRLSVETGWQRRIHKVAKSRGGSRQPTYFFRCVCVSDDPKL